MLIIWKVKLHCYKLTSQNTRLAPLALNSPKNILASKSYEDNYICIMIHYFISLFHELRNRKTAKILELIYFGVCDGPSGLYRPSLSLLPFLWSISTHSAWDNSQHPLIRLYGEKHCESKVISSLRSQYSELVKGPKSGARICLFTHWQANTFVHLLLVWD